MTIDDQVNGWLLELTDEELIVMHSMVYDTVYYGDDSIAYAEPGTSVSVDALRSAEKKLDDEIDRRGL